MPRFDGTGPNGQGPRTGRGMGMCRGMGFGYGNGYGNGCGCQGYGFGMNSMYSPKNRANLLKTQAQYLENELGALREEIKSLEAEPNSDNQ